MLTSLYSKMGRIAAHLFWRRCLQSEKAFQQLLGMLVQGGGIFGDAERGHVEVADGGHGVHVETVGGTERGVGGRRTAAALGVDLCGFIFAPQSPRAVTPEQAAALMLRMPASA